MKYILLSILMLGILSCQQENKTENAPQPKEKDLVEKPVQPLDLVGKKIEYRYGESIYHLTVDSPTELNWECVQGDEKGVTGDENYKMQRIGARVLFLSWIEENDLGVSQVLDFEQGKVYTFLKRGEEVDSASGEIKLID